MRIAVYPGCMVLARFQEYELASRLVLEQLGYEIVDLDEFCCCGASLLPGVTDNWINLSVYSLALAEQSGVDIVTLCGNCTNNFKRANLDFEKDQQTREKTGAVLGKLDLTYEGKVKVQHLIEVLINRLEDIRKLVKRYLKCKVAITFPCQVLRPKEITCIQDGRTGPQAFRKILKSLNVEIIDYPKEHECCGATALLFDEEAGVSHGRAKLESAKVHGADVISAACGNCLFLLDRYQNKIAKINPDLRMPVVSLSQLIGISFGYSKESLGLKTAVAFDFE